MSKTLTDDDGNKYEVKELVGNNGMFCTLTPLQPLPQPKEEKTSDYWVKMWDDHDNRELFYLEQRLVLTQPAARAITAAIFSVLQYCQAKNPNLIGETVYIRDAIDKARAAVQKEK